MPSDIAIYSHGMNEDEEDGREKKKRERESSTSEDVVASEGGRGSGFGGRAEAAAGPGGRRLKSLPIDPRPPRRFTKMNECWANRM